MMKKAKMSLFWRSYIILCAVLAALIVMLTVFFYDFISAYEVGRPEYAVKKYIDDMTEGALTELVESELGERLSGYELDGAVEREVKSALEENGLSYVRSFSDSEGDVPRYDIYCGEKLLTVTLAVTDGGKYSFDNYAVVAESLADEWLEARTNTVTIIVPTGAESKLNGKPVGEDRLVTSFVPDTVSVFEKDGFSVNMYEIDGVFGEVTVKALLDDEALQLDNPTAGVYSSVYESVESVYTVIAPDKAEVTLNGIKLTDEYVTGYAIPNDARKFESDTDVRCRVYSVKGLRLVPTVTATLDGNTLSSSESELYDCEFGYPDSYRHTEFVTVPKGAVLYCNGVEVDSGYAAGKSKYELPESARKFAKANSSGIKYAIDGIYGKPTFTAVYPDGEACVSDESGKVFYMRAKGSEQRELDEKASHFIELYINYTFIGRKHLAENYAAVLGETAEKSSAYKILKSTYNAIYFNHAYEIDKLESTVYDFVKYSDGCFGAKIDFSAHGNYYKYEKSAEGTYTTVWCVSDGELKLVEFVLS